MPRFALLAASVLFLTLALVIPLRAQSTEPPAEAVVSTGVVTGQVVNGTAGGAVPANLEVTLYRFEQTREGVADEATTTTIDSAGGFTFPDVLLDPAQTYVVSVAYRGRVFTSDLVTGDVLQAGAPLPIAIYELTEDPDVITITSVDTRIDVVGDGLQVLQGVTFRNHSDRMFTGSTDLGGGRYASVIINLPPGAVGLAFPGGEERFIVPQEGTAVVDTSPVLPGVDHNVQLSYFVPYDNGAVIEQEVYYALDGVVRLLLRPAIVTAQSDQLQSAGVQTVEDREYQVYSGDLILAPGDVIGYELRGSVTAAAAAAATPNNLGTLLVIGLIIEVIVIGGLVYLYLRRRRPAPNR